MTQQTMNIKYGTWKLEFFLIYSFDACGKWSSVTLVTGITPKKVKLNNLNLKTISENEKQNLIGTVRSNYVPSWAEYYVACLLLDFTSLSESKNMQIYFINKLWFDYVSLSLWNIIPYRFREKKH